MPTGLPSSASRAAVRIRSAASSARSTGGSEGWALGDPRLAPASDSRPAGAQQPGGEDPGGGRPTGQGGARAAHGLLLGQPAAQGAEVESGDVDVAQPGGVLEQPRHVTEVGPHRVRGQVALGDEVALVLPQHPGHRLRELVRLTRLFRHSAECRQRRSGQVWASAASRQPASPASTRPARCSRVRADRTSSRPRPAVRAIESARAPLATGTASRTCWSRRESRSRGRVRAAGLLHEVLARAAHQLEHLGAAGHQRRRAGPDQLVHALRRRAGHRTRDAQQRPG